MSSAFSAAVISPVWAMTAVSTRSVGLARRRFMLAEARLRGGSAYWFAQVRRFCGRCPWLSA